MRHLGLSNCFSISISVPYSGRNLLKMASKQVGIQKEHLAEEKTIVSDNSLVAFTGLPLEYYGAMELS